MHSPSVALACVLTCVRDTLCNVNMCVTMHYARDTMCAPLLRWHVCFHACVTPSVTLACVLLCIMRVIPCVPLCCVDMCVSMHA
jgi:hypothetical protein